MNETAAVIKEMLLFASPFTYRDENNLYIPVSFFPQHLGGSH